MGKTAFSGYPDPFVSREEKLDKKYGVQYFKRMYKEWADEEIGSGSYVSRNERYTRYREYAEGMQSIEQYKDLLGANGDSSYLNLNWEVVPVIPKFVDVIVGGLTNQEYKIKCTAIDQLSKDKRAEDKLKKLTAM